MITVSAEGASRFRIHDRQGRVVGWIRGHTVGFRGWRSEDDAIAAAAVAWGPLEGALRRHYFGRALRLTPHGPLRLVHDGAYEWVSDGRQPIARLLREPRHAADDAPLALEFVLPAYATPAVVHAVVHVVARALGFLEPLDAPASHAEARVDAGVPAHAGASLAASPVVPPFPPPAA